MTDEEGLKTIDITIDGMHCERCVDTIKHALEAEEGVEYIDVTVGKARIGYLPQLVTANHLKDRIKDSGYSLHENTKRKGFFGRYIDRMIENNQKIYGDQRLDCCSLPKDDVARRSAQKGHGRVSHG